MASELFLLTLMRAQIAAGVSIVLALALRGLARRWLGPAISYKLWGLVPAAVTASLMPSLSECLNGGVVRHASPAAALQPAWLQAITMLQFWSRDSSWLVVAWAGGAIGLALSFMWGEVRFRSLAARGLVGPAVVGVAAPRLVVPTDFRLRFNERERALIRRHERTHIEENHPLTNLLIAVLQAVFWFNPLVHLAATKCRFDQELACDAIVIDARSKDRRAYGEALLKAHLVGPRLTGSPLACAWISAPSHPLEARLRALQRPSLNVHEYVRGAVVVSAAIALLAAMVWGSAPNQEIGAALTGSVHPAGNSLVQAVGLPAPPF